MKRMLIVICFFALALAGCSSKEAPAQPTQPTSSTVEAKDGIVDLTALSSTMVYSEVYNMISSPDNYLNKTVKMKGDFSSYHDPVTNKTYFACIIQDATACCQQGIEFELSDAKYPDDYPKEGEEITVTGTFDKYMEGDMQYLTLRNAKLS